MATTTLPEIQPLSRHPSVDLERPLLTPENQPPNGEGSLLLTKISLACHTLLDDKSHVFSIVHSVLHNLVHG